jgi:hypothetical protein
VQKRTKVALTAVAVTLVGIVALSVNNTSAPGAGDNASLRDASGVDSVFAQDSEDDDSMFAREAGDADDTVARDAADGDISSTRHARDAGQSSAFAAPADAVSQGATQTAAIHDPAIDMDAFSVTYPENWHFQGAMVQGTPCSGIPFPVFRMFSPDGLTEIERLPRLDWFWSTASNGARAPDGCLPIQQAMSARDFVKYDSAMLKVQYVSEDAIPQAILDANDQTMQRVNGNTAKLYANSGRQPTPQTSEMAAAIVRYQNGTVSMAGLLLATVLCNTAGDNHTCSGTIRYTHAPDGQLQAVVASTTDGIGATENPQWVRTYNQMRTHQMQQTTAAIQQASQLQMAAQQQQFEQGQAIRQRQHEEFMSTLQRGTDMSMNRAAQIANSNHMIAADWTDFALGQQTVRDPSSGQLYHVPSTSSYTWIDQDKNAYQTMDPSANPNGVFQGNWTRQQVVHGDGSDR